MSLPPASYGPFGPSERRPLTPAPPPLGRLSGLLARTRHNGEMTRTVRGARILITGAASGMGRLYAERAVREGARAVVVWDKDAEALDHVVTELRAIVIADREEAPWGGPARSPSSA